MIPGALANSVSIQWLIMTGSAPAPSNHASAAGVPPSRKTKDSSRQLSASEPSVACLAPQRAHDLVCRPWLLGLGHEQGAQLVQDRCRSRPLQFPLRDDARDRPAAARELMISSPAST
jgi:hypothetical protein